MPAFMLEACSFKTTLHMNTTDDDRQTTDGFAIAETRT